MTNNLDILIKARDEAVKKIEKDKMNKKPRTVINGIPVWCAHDDIVAIDQLLPNPRNPNMHPDKQIKLLGDIILSQGWRGPITVSTRSGFIVCQAFF